MNARKPKVRLFVAAPLAGAGPIEVSVEQAHYLVRVMRLGPGDEVALFNGRDGEWRARIESAGRRTCRLVPEAPLRAQRAEPGPWLLFAPVKKTAIDFMVEKATELGAEVLWPAITARTVAARVNVERLRARAVEAAEQCERLTVPGVRQPAALTSLAGAWPQNRRLLVLDEHGGGPPAADAMRSLAGASGPPPGLLVGPEGGFAPSELDALAGLPFVARVALGPRILRAETAALSALACWQALAGDWTQPPPARG